MRTPLKVAYSGRTYCLDPSPVCGLSTKTVNTLVFDWPWLDADTIPEVDQSLRLPLRTSRLKLRALGDADAAAHERLFSNPDVVRYLYDEALTDDAARRHLSLRHWKGLTNEGGWANLAVDFGGQLIGEVGVSLVSRVHRTCEIGYVFLPEAGGQGLATEAARVAVDIAMTFHDALRVVARLDARNSSSAQLLERLGFRREAHFHRNEFVKGEWTDELVYAILADEWTVTTKFD